MRGVNLIWACMFATVGRGEAPPAAGFETYVRIVDGEEQDHSVMLLEADALIRFGLAEGSCAHAQTGLAVQFAAHTGLGAEVSEAMLRQEIAQVCDSSAYSGMIWHSIGHFRFAQGQIKSAEQAFHAALSQAQHLELRRRIMNGLAGCSWRRGDVDQTWNWMNRAWRVDSLNAPGYLVNNLLAISLLSGHFEQAAHQAEIYLAHTPPDDQVVPFIQANLLQVRLQLNQASAAMELVRVLPWTELLLEDPVETTKTAFQVAVQLGVLSPIELSRAHWQGDDKPYSAHIRSALGWRAIARNPNVLPVSDLPHWAEYIPVSWNGVWGMPEELPSSVVSPHLLPTAWWWSVLGLCSLAVVLMGMQWIRLGRIRRSLDAPHEAQRSGLMQAVSREQRLRPMERLRASYVLAAGWIEEPLKPDARAVAIWATLTQHEQRIIEGTFRNETPKEVAQELDISPKHVYNTRSRIRTKLGIPTDADFKEHCRKLFPQFFPILLLASAVSLAATDSDLPLPEALRSASVEALQAADSVAIAEWSGRIEALAEADSAAVAEALGRTRWLWPPWRDAWQQHWDASGIQFPLDELIASHLGQILERETRFRLPEHALQPFSRRALAPLEAKARFRWMAWAVAFAAVVAMAGAWGATRRRVCTPIKQLRAGSVNRPPEVVAWGKEVLELLEAPSRSRLERIRGELLLARLDRYRRATPTNWLNAAQQHELEIRFLKARGLSELEVASVLQGQAVDLK